MKKLMIALLAICMSASVFAAKKDKPRPEELLLMIQTLQAQVVELQTQIEAIGPHYTDADAIAAVGPHSPDFSLLLDGLDRYYDDNGYDTLIFSGMNVQVVSGSGSTGGTVNGTGNLIIGYNEVGGSGGGDRTGSHMLVLGRYNDYSAFGGMVGGSNNRTYGDYASVIGGGGNIAWGRYATISGGVSNNAWGESSSVSGGVRNSASGEGSSVSGGYKRSATGDFDWAAGSLYEDDTP